MAVAIDNGHGDWPVRALLRGRLLRRLCDQPHPPGRGYEADHRLHAGPAHRHHHHCRCALDLHRIPVMEIVLWAEGSAACPLNRARKALTTTRRAPLRPFIAEPIDT